MYLLLETHIPNSHVEGLGQDRDGVGAVVERPGCGGGVVARDPVQELGNLTGIHIRPVVWLFGRLEVKNYPGGQLREIKLKDSY